MDFLKISSHEFKNIAFHIIGPIKNEVKHDNIIYYGHMKFHETIPYIKYADVGLVTRKANAHLVKSLTDTLKVLQYSYCKLPVIAPSIMKSNRLNWFSYDLNKNSIKNAVHKALEFDRDNFDNSDIYDWSVLAKRIAENA